MISLYNYDQLSLFVTLIGLNRWPCCPYNFFNPFLLATSFSAHVINLHTKGFLKNIYITITYHISSQMVSQFKKQYYLWRKIILYLFRFSQHFYLYKKTMVSKLQICYECHHKKSSNGTIKIFFITLITKLSLMLYT